MNLLDTDTFSLYLPGHARVTERARAAEDSSAITIITRIEVLRGRFESLLTAADAGQLHHAQAR